MKKIISSVIIFLLSVGLAFADVASKNPILQDEGTTVAGSGRILNFTGAGVAVTFAGGKYVITIGGGAGGNNWTAAGDTGTPFLVGDTAETVTLKGAGINTVSAGGNVWTVTGTEVDGSITNEIEVVDDTYGIAWSVDTTHAASKKSLYDKIETLGVGSGDVTSVGDCTGGACLDGTSDGGTYIKFYDAEGAGTLILPDIAGAVTWTLPSTGGTLIHTEVDPTVDTDDEIIAIINASPSTTIKHEAGGLEADVSAYAGLVHITGGTTSAKTLGIADTNISPINAADVADNDYAKFTATGLEGRSYSEVLSDIGAQATVTEGSLADSVIISADIKDTVIIAADMANADHGDMGWTAGVGYVDDDSHAHTASTISGLGTDDISGLDISADTNLAVTAPIVLTDDTISIPKADDTTNGYLWSTDRVTFNGKMDGALAKDLVTTTPLAGGTDNILPGADADITLSITKADTSTNGYLWSTDWNTFNDKMAGTLLKDLVTTAPLTGGTNDIFPGADADITIAIPVATSTANGYLWSTDWVSFDGKMAGTLAGDLVTTAPITGGVNDIFPGSGTKATIAIPVATTSANGYLWSTDWTTFNAKQAALGYTPSYQWTVAGTTGADLIGNTAETWTLVGAGGNSTAESGNTMTITWTSVGLGWNGNAIANTKGGTGQDSSTWTGIGRVAAGTWTVDPQKITFHINTPNATTFSNNIWAADRAITLTSVDLTLGSGTWSIKGQLLECNNAGASCVVTSATNWTVTAGTTLTWTTFSNATIASGGQIGWTTSACSWTTGNGSVGVTMKYQ